MNTYRPGDARRVPAHCFVESLCCKHTTSLTRLTSIKLKTITPKFKHSFFDTISKLCTPTLSRSPSAPPAPQYDLFSAAGWVYRMARTQEGRARNQIPSPFQKPHSSVLVRGVGRQRGALLGLYWHSVGVPGTWAAGSCLALGSDVCGLLICIHLLNSNGAQPQPHLASGGFGNGFGVQSSDRRVYSRPKNSKPIKLAL